jgi:hypothetical protein
MEAGADPARQPAEKRWRRRALWSLLLLVPAVLALTGYGSVRTLLGNEDLVARDVAWGKKVRFGGSDWQLTDLRAALGMADLPPNAVPVLADFTVKIGDPDLPELWLGCRIGLQDRAGRRWLPTSAVALNAPDDVRTCGSTVFSGAHRGDTVKIRETFLVPRDATATIRPMVGLASERPYYLLFQRPQE